MSTTLLESIDHLNDALKDEASKRRWGRGLTYFRQRASNAGRRNISSSIAPGCEKNVPNSTVALWWHFANTC